MEKGKVKDMSLVYEIIKSWNHAEGNVNSMDDIMQWIKARNTELKVNIEKVDFSYDGFWYYDMQKGYIKNKNNSFFQLAGYQEIEDDTIIGEQPIIIQDEIGYLGIICKMIDGVLNFLIQAKIEPGNINVIQLSPTIQATKSNFMKMHGGVEPAYLQYFVDVNQYKVLVDQIQSEQASRFYKKRNRNIVLLVEDDIEVLDNHKWMTLGQIKECMKHDNLVNMDTRTVLSCIPFRRSELEEGEYEKIEGLFTDKALCRSIFKEADYQTMGSMFSAINDYKMYRRDRSRLVPLKSLKKWALTDKEIVCKKRYDFKVIYCRIEIEGREVKYWEQPLMEALGTAVVGLFTCVQDGIRKYLLKVKAEMGCFDTAELGPAVQLEPSKERNLYNNIEKDFINRLDHKKGIVKDIILSEEGGRFYHEQNRNVIIEIDADELSELPEGFFWVDFATISGMIQFNNCVNIQLRNLIALVDL